jgi:LETM1 and EF-hand domain-containing protein 1, mitochondrial
VLEEIIPLIVIYAPSILPSTCVLPSQLAKIQAKQDERQVKWLQAAAGDSSLCLRMQELMSIRAIDLNTLTGNSLQVLCGYVIPSIFYPSAADSHSSNRILRLSTTGPSLLLRSRLTKHLHMLSSDDALLSRENMGSWLDARGVREALSERGMCVPSSIFFPLSCF